MKCDAKRLEEIEAREKAAFIGPWTHSSFTVECGEFDPRCPEGPDDCEGEREATRIEAPEEYPGGQVVCDVYGLERFAQANAAFLAAARQDVPDLLADLLEARAALELWSKFPHQAQTHCDACGLHAADAIVATERALGRIK